jgi:hypothetical protein
MTAAGGRDRLRPVGQPQIPRFWTAGNLRTGVIGCPHCWPICHEEIIEHLEHLELAEVYAASRVHKLITCR